MMKKLQYFILRDDFKVLIELSTQQKEKESFFFSWGFYTNIYLSQIPVWHHKYDERNKKKWEGADNWIRKFYLFIYLF